MHADKEAAFLRTASGKCGVTFDSLDSANDGSAVDLEESKLRIWIMHTSGIVSAVVYITFEFFILCISMHISCAFHIYYNTYLGVKCLTS